MGCTEGARPSAAKPSALADADQRAPRSGVRVTARSPGGARMARGRWRGEKSYRAAVIPAVVTCLMRAYACMHMHVHMPAHAHVHVM